MKKLIMVLLLLPFFSVTACAELDIGIDMSGLESALPEETRSLSGELVLDGEYDSTGALQRLWTGFCRRFSESLNEEWRTIFGVAAISLFSAAAASVCPVKKTADYIHIASCAVAALLLTEGLDSMVSRSVSAIDQLSDYSKAAMPALFTAAAASGAAISAPARYGAVCLALDVMISLSKRLLIPLIYTFLAVIISAGLFPHPILSGVSKLLKRFIVLMMTATTMIFTAFIGITGIVTASTDAAAVKTAKTVISAAFPIVGGILSDAAGSVLSAASVVRNAAGAFCLVAVCALCLGPFAVLSVKLLLFRLAAAVSDMVPGSQLSALLDQMASVMAMLLGLVGSYGLMLFFSFVSAIRVVTP